MRLRRLSAWIKLSGVPSSGLTKMMSFGSAVGYRSIEKSMGLRGCPVRRAPCHVKRKATDPDGTRSGIQDPPSKKSPAISAMSDPEAAAGRNPAAATMVAPLRVMLRNSLLVFILLSRANVIIEASRLRGLFPGSASLVRCSWPRHCFPPRLD